MRERAELEGRERQRQFCERRCAATNCTHRLTRGERGVWKVCTNKHARGPGVEPAHSVGGTPSIYFYILVKYTYHYEKCLRSIHCACFILVPVAAASHTVDMVLYSLGFASIPPKAYESLQRVPVPVPTISQAHASYPHVPCYLSTVLKQFIHCSDLIPPASISKLLLLCVDPQLWT